MKTTQTKTLQTNFNAALISGDIKAFVDLINDGSIDVNKADAAGQLPLHILAHFGHTKAAQLLIHKSNINDIDANGRTALHYAVANNQENMVNFLINSGADITKPDIHQQTTLHFAIGRGNQNIVELLLRKSFYNNSKSHQNYLNHKDFQNNTALDVALFSQKNNLAELLKSKGAPINKEVVEFLLHNKAEIVLPDIDGISPLHKASAKGHTDIVKLLLKGAKVNEVDTKNATALHYAADGGHIDIVQLLLDANANVNHKDANNATPLVYAARSGHEDTVALLLQNKALVNDGKNSPTLYAAANGHIKVIKQLINHGDKTCHEYADVVYTLLKQSKALQDNIAEIDDLKDVLQSKGCIELQGLLEGQKIEHIYTTADQKISKFMGDEQALNEQFGHLAKFKDAQSKEFIELKELFEGQKILNIAGQQIAHIGYESDLKVLAEHLAGAFSSLVIDEIKDIHMSGDIFPPHHD